MKEDSGAGVGLVGRRVIVRRGRVKDLGGVVKVSWVEDSRRSGDTRV